MRVIEKNILFCIKEGINGKVMTRQLSARDRVESTTLSVCYYLHGTCLMDYDRVRDELSIGPEGWDTVTTVSRVKALLHLVYPGALIYKRGPELYIRYDGREGCLPYLGRHTFISVRSDYDI